MMGFRQKAGRRRRTQSPRFPVVTQFCEFPGVAAGTYAVSAFHDENSNGKLDRNFMGIPREGVGASNNAKGHLGHRSSMRRRFAFQAAAWS